MLDYQTSFDAERLVFVDKTRDVDQEAALFGAQRATHGVGEMSASRSVQPAPFRHPYLICVSGVQIAGGLPPFPTPAEHTLLPSFLRVVDRAQVQIKGAQPALLAAACGSINLAQCEIDAHCPQIRPCTPFGTREVEGSNPATSLGNLRGRGAKSAPFAQLQVSPVDRNVRKSLPAAHRSAEKRGRLRP
jgi:hypothetical protein